MIEITDERVRELMLIYDSVYGDYLHSKDEKDIRDCLDDLIAVRQRIEALEKALREIVNYYLQCEEKDEYFDKGDILFIARDALERNTDDWHFQGAPIAKKDK
jgi:hypothetical protein